MKFSDQSYVNMFWYVPKGYAYINSVNKVRMFVKVEYIIYG